MIEIKNICWLVFFLIVLNGNGLAQNVQPSVSAGADEKIYIHFDKPYYAAGETIWFKAYLYNNRLPSFLSNNFYLKLVDQHGNVIEEKKYPIVGATVAGNIILTDSLEEGYYSIMAATKNIAVNDAGFFYTKHLFIYNPLVKQADSALTGKITLQFFPESGHLIDRIRTQVAFKATDETGNPVNVEGFIKSDTGTVMAPFKSFHDGMGKVTFTPHSGDIFYAELYNNGIISKYPLPKVEPSGVYLKIMDADSGKIFEITRSKNDKESFDTVKLVVKMNNEIVYENVISFGFQQTLSGLLKTGDIPSGILHFVVMNNDGVPIAERLSFVNNKEYVSQPELITIRRDSSKRGANSYEIRFDDTTQRSFSISVTDFTAQQFPDRESIYARLLLTSDLKGYVFDPAYYFNGKDASTAAALDNLMMTHGWTRYNCRKLPLKKDISINNDDHYLIHISGTINDAENGRPVSRGMLNFQIIAADSTIQSFDAVVDRNGRFDFDSLLFFGNARIYYSYANERGKKISTVLQVDKKTTNSIFSILSADTTESIVSAKIRYNVNGQVVFNPNQVFDLKFKQLSTVFLKTKKTRPGDKVNNRYASSLFSTSGKLVLDNINDPYNDNSLNVMDYIMVNIRSLDIDRSDGTLVNRKNFSLESAKNWKVELLLDENISTVENMKRITVGQVAMVKFYEAGFVGVGSSAPGGAVAVYLKKDEDMGPVSASNKQNYLSYEGYSVTQEFYQPNYNIPAPEHSLPDNRITLYWNPAIITNAGSGNVKFNFFNNDVTKKISISIEGFDATGRLIHYENSNGE